MSRDAPPQTAASQLQAKPERIAKAVARAGLCSRREAEAWIAEGRVAVNGVVIASPALTVTAQDRIEIDGKPLPQRERTRLFLYYKPVGLVTTNVDPEGRPTIFSALPATLPRLVSIGRLDINTEGLLLLTNDGGLARVLELPATGWLRRYRVRAHGHVDQAALARLRDGLTVDGVRYGPIEAALDREQGANVWLTMAIREGKNREVRNIVEALGLQANRLIRISFGPFQLGETAEGETVEVKTRLLREQLGERIAAEAGCDFSAPVVVRTADDTRAPRTSEPPQRARRAESEQPRRAEREQPRGRPERRSEKRFPSGNAKRPRRNPRGERETDKVETPQGRPRRGHAWRAEDAPLGRHYRGAESKARQRPEPPAGPKRAGLIADRKGRRVLVERFGEKAAKRPDEGRADARGDARPARHGKPTKRNTPLPNPPPHGGREQTRGKLRRGPGDTQQRRDGGKPRRSRPESRDRPRGAGPRPSCPKPR